MHRLTSYVNINTNQRVVKTCNAETEGVATNPRGVVMGDRFSDLDPANQARIRGALKISAVWGGFILISAGIFICSKPYLDRKRKERENSEQNINKEKDSP